MAKKKRLGTRQDRDGGWKDVPLELEWMRYSQEGGILGLEEIDGAAFQELQVREAADRDKHNREDEAMQIAKMVHAPGQGDEEESGARARRLAGQQRKKMRGQAQAQAQVKDTEEREREAREELSGGGGLRSREDETCTEAMSAGVGRTPQRRRMAAKKEGLATAAEPADVAQRGKRKRASPGESGPARELAKGESGPAPELAKGESGPARELAKGRLGVPAAGNVVHAEKTKRSERRPEAGDVGEEARLGRPSSNDGSAEYQAKRVKRRSIAQAEAASLSRAEAAADRPAPAAQAEGSPAPKARKGQGKRERPAAASAGACPVGAAGGQDADGALPDADCGPGQALCPQVDVVAWQRFGLHTELLSALARAGFASPTPIQAACLPAALTARKDVIGAAETGSGKTLAFGLPIAQHLLLDAEAEAPAEGVRGQGAEAEEVVAADDGGAAGCRHRPRDAPTALILLPTRELALQVCAHLEAILPREPRFRVLGLVGGMAIPKQRRVLAKRPAVIVATPGRLWELMSRYSDEHLLRVNRARFLVLDEADRMVAPGHFAELDAILDVVESGALPGGKVGGGVGTGTPEESGVDEEAEVAEVDIGMGTEVEAPGPGAPSRPYPRQIFLFSATLTLPASLRRRRGSASRARDLGRQRAKSEGGKKSAALVPRGLPADGEGDNPAMTRLVERLKFQNPVEVVDLSRKSLTVEKLQQRKLAVLPEDKEASLFALLMSLRPRRGVVFANSISCVRRLGALLPLLEVPTVTLHASMQQRQRLQHLDKFKKTDGAVLLATDVAARGLDIPGLEFVVHYQLPHTVETYVHRAGRTARARAEGLSVAVVEPRDEKRYRTICHGLGPDSAAGLEPYSGIENSAVLLPRVHRAIHLASKMDQELHAERRRRADSDWLARAAREMEIDMDDDLVETDDERTKPAPSEKRRAREELKGLLQKLTRPTAAQRAAAPMGQWQVAHDLVERI